MTGFWSIWTMVSGAGVRYLGGLRLNELCLLTWAKVGSDQITIDRRIHGKSRGRVVPMSKALQELVNANRANDKRDQLTVTRHLKPWGSPVSASASLNRVLKEGGDAIGVDRIRVHDLRHTFAWMAAQVGADLGDLVDMMRHARIEMTLRYRGFLPNRSKSIIMGLREGVNL